MPYSVWFPCSKAGNSMNTEDMFMKLLETIDQYEDYLCWNFGDDRLNIISFMRARSK